MKLQHIVTTHESESSLRGHLAAYLEKAGYRPVSVHPFLVYRRGSLLSSLFALSPKSQRATVSIEIKPADDLTTAALLSLEAKTEGEFVLDSKGRFWQDEFEGMVAAASSGTTASDAATGHTEARFDLKQTASVEAGLKMQSRLAGGASWFYVVAALSLVNTLVFVSGGNLNFLVGLGITQIVDGFASGFAQAAGADAGRAIRIVDVAIDFGIAGLFALFGFLAKKRHQWAFIIGMALYALDALVFLWVKDLVSIAFHLLVLFGLFNGLKAAREMSRLQQTETSTAQ